MPGKLHSCKVCVDRFGRKDPAGTGDRAASPGWFVSVWNQGPPALSQTDAGTCMGPSGPPLPEPGSLSVGRVGVTAEAPRARLGLSSALPEDAEPSLRHEQPRASGLFSAFWNIPTQLRSEVRFAPCRAGGGPQTVSLSVGVCPPAVEPRWLGPCSRTRGRGRPPSCSFRAGVHSWTWGGWGTRPSSPQTRRACDQVSVADEPASNLIFTALPARALLGAHMHRDCLHGLPVTSV